MKNAFVALLAFLFFKAVAVSADCQDINLTFNLKPKFAGGSDSATDYVCGDAGNDEIGDMIKAKMLEKMDEFGLDAQPNNIRMTGCPTYPCSENPGHRCLPFCVDVTTCGFESLTNNATPALSDSQILEMQADVIDHVRDSFPDCLGIKYQFMLDLHASLSGASRR